MNELRITVPILILGILLTLSDAALPSRAWAQGSGVPQTGGWTSTGPSLGLSTLLLAPSYPQPRLMWMGTDDGLWRSEDGGDTWQRVTAGLDPALEYVALAFAPGYPTDGRAFTAGWGDDGTATLFRSADGGITWTAVASLGGSSTITLSPIFDQDGVALVAASESGVLRSQDGGLTWTAVPDVPGPRRVILSPDFAHDGLAYALTNTDDVWRSTDGGQTWHQADFQASALAFSPGFAQDHILFRGWLDLYRSTDGGTTWEMIRPYASGVMRALVLSPAFPQDGVLFLTEAIQPHGYPVIVWRSGDGGRTWTQVAEGGRWWSTFAGRGEPVLSPAFARDGLAFILSDQGLLRSTDGGRRWDFWRPGHGRFLAWKMVESGGLLVTADGQTLFQSSNGQGWQTLARFTDPSIDYIADVALSPSNASGGPIVVARCLARGGCIVGWSEDGGQTWLWDAVGSRVAFSQDGAILFVVDRGVLIRYRVVDWTEMDRQPLAPHIPALLVAGKEVYVGLSDGGILRSENQGASWTRVGTVPLPLAWLSAAGDWLYAGSGYSVGADEVHRSADGGVTWEVAPVPPWPVRTVAADSEGALYAGTIGGGVYRSTDDGDTWIAWNAGLDASWHHGAMDVYTLVRGPEGQMYAGTARGVWRLATPGSFYLVNTTDDQDDGVCDSTHCSLREAINAANATYRENPRIAFNIPTSDAGYDPVTGVWTIRPQRALPALAPGNITLDGTTQADHQGDTNPLGPEIELDGSAAGAGDKRSRGDKPSRGFKVDAGPGTNERNGLSGTNPGAGHEISERDRLSGVDGLTIAGTSMGNTVRGLVINNFSGAGIALWGPHTTVNFIVGNYIGTDPQGRVARPNEGGGVLLEAAAFNTIGGEAPGDRNLISGNLGSGIELRRSNENVVLGNRIGTDAGGMQAIGNGWAGVLLRDESQSNTIGGWRSSQGNLLSGNSYGVQLAGLRTLDNVIQGNRIGTDVSGTAPLPNGIGVSVRGAWRTVVRDNTISGNTQGGLHLWEGATSNTIVGNRIGTAADGVSALGNGFYGINVVEGARLNRIGGPGEGNRIAHNAGPGVVVIGSGTAGNTISGNSITANQGAGIGLADGGNGELPAPDISLIDIRQCVVSGIAPPNARVEVFSDPEDEGQHYEGATTADQLGRFWWRGGFRGPHVTATATDSAGNTSEFAAPVAGRCYVVWLPVVLRVQ